MSALVAAARLVHPYPAALVVMLSAVLLTVVDGSVPGFGILLRAVLVVLMSQIAVGSLNDYLDRRIDARMQPDKPIPSELVSARVALWMVIGSLLLFVPVAASFGLPALGVAVLGTAGGLAYDLWLKPTILSALGYVIGFLSLITWIWIIADRLKPSLVLAYPVGALILVAANLANSYPDIETDRELGQKGLAASLGAPRAKLAILLCYCTVLGAGFGLGLYEQSPGGLALMAAATVALAIGLRLGRESADRPKRILFFRATAGGIALLAIGGFLLITRLST